MLTIVGWVKPGFAAPTHQDGRGGSWLEDSLDPPYEIHHRINRSRRGKCGLWSFLSKNPIDHPAAAGMSSPGVAAVAQDAFVLASCVLERICKYRHTVECTLIVDALSQRDTVDVLQRNRI